jgi:hypothetical protein
MTETSTRTVKSVDGKSSLPMSPSRSNARSRQKRMNRWKERKRTTRPDRLRSKNENQQREGCLCGAHQRGLWPFGSAYDQPRVKKPLRQTIYARAIGWRSWCVRFVTWQRQTKPVCQSWTHRHHRSSRLLNVRMSLPSGWKISYLQRIEAWIVQVGCRIRRCLTIK